MNKIIEFFIANHFKSSFPNMIIRFLLEYLIITAKGYGLAAAGRINRVNFNQMTWAN